MCGPSSGEKTAAAQQADLASTMTSTAKNVIGADDKILFELQNAYESTVRAGFDQFGFGQGEFNARNAAVMENVAQAYRNVAGAAKAGQAGYGGGNEVLASGATTAANVAIAEKAAAAQAAGENAVLQEGYDVGRKKFEFATGMLQKAPSEIYSNVAPIAGEATKATTESMKDQQQLNAQGNWWVAPVMGAVNAGLSLATGGFSNMFTKGAGNGMDLNTNAGGGGEQTSSSESDLYAGTTPGWGGR